MVVVFVSLLVYIIQKHYIIITLYFHKEIARREQEGQLDEGFLSEVNAQLRQVSLFVCLNLSYSGLLYYPEFFSHATLIFLCKDGGYIPRVPLNRGFNETSLYIILFAPIMRLLTYYIIYYKFKHNIASFDQLSL